MEASRRRPNFTLFSLLCAVLVFAAFFPTLHNGFIYDWDDGGNFLANSHIRGFSWPEIRWMLSAVISGHYHPLTWLSLAFDYRLWGLDPRGYHLTSLLLHCGNVVLFFFVAKRLLMTARPDLDEDRTLGTCVLAGLFFGLHPLRVESVAWASERRDVLSAFFYLATLLFWLRRERGPALACYAASLLSKAMGITLPFALLIFERWPLREYRGYREKLPFFAMAAGAALMSFVAEAPNGAASSLAVFPLWARFGSAAYGLVFYLLKTAWPSRLSPIYAMPTDLWSAWPRFAAAIALVCGVSFWLFRSRGRRPALAAATGYYALTLAPVLGLAHFGPQLVADRYSYLACLPWALLAASALAGSAGSTRGLRFAVGFGVCLALGAATWRQALAWRDSDALWTHAAEVDPGCWVARLYLGNHAMARGNATGAERLYREAITINPSYAAAYNNLGNALIARRQPQEALAALSKAQELSPDHPGIHGNRARALAMEGRPQEAARELGLEKTISEGSR